MDNEPSDADRGVVELRAEAVTSGSEEKHQKILYEMWTSVDSIISREVFEVFNSYNQIFHFGFAPLLFLTQWRNESHSTRDFLTDTDKTNNFSNALQPIWHKRLCARLSHEFSQYIMTKSVFTDLKPVHVNNSLLMNPGMPSEMNYNAYLTRYYKQSVTEATGGILILETGFSQPFFYIKLSFIDKNMIGSQVQNKPQSLSALLDRLHAITNKLHVHSFTYDFHVHILSERLNRLVQKQILERRRLSILLEHTNPTQSSSNRLKSGNAKNVMARFFDDFLKYYEQPPLHSNCLVLKDVFKCAKLLVTSKQLYEYILNNCSRDCNNMGVIKICDKQSVDIDDGSFLFDDDFNYDNDDEDSISGKSIDFIIVRHMTGNDIQQIEKSKFNSNHCIPALKEHEYANYQYEVCGLYDVTLVMTISAKNSVLDSRDEIFLPYYVFITKNDCDILEKKETASPETSPCTNNPRFYHNNHLLVSTSLPSSFYGNIPFRSSTQWEKGNEFCSYDDLYSSQETIKTELSPHSSLSFNVPLKNDCLTTFYQKKAAELVTLTVDSIAKRCSSHLLWQKFNKFFDQPQSGPKIMTTRDVEKVINKSELFKPLVEYDRKLAPIIEEFAKDHFWFNALYKLIAQQLLSSSSASKTMRYHIFKNNSSKHQYLVLLPNRCCSIELNAFIVIDNGIDLDENVLPTSNSLIHIVQKRNDFGSEEVNKLIELVGSIFHTWKSSSNVSRSRKSFMSRVKKLITF